MATYAATNGTPHGSGDGSLAYILHVFEPEHVFKSRLCMLAAHAPQVLRQDVLGLNFARRRDWHKYNVVASEYDCKGK